LRAHLAALSAFALAQPLFDILGRNAEFFVAHRSTALDVVAFALAVTVVPPVLLLGAELVVGLASPPARTIFHLVAVALLLALLALQVVKRLAGGPTALLLFAAAAAGVAGAIAYRRLPVARTFLTVLAPAPLVFLALFLFASPVSKITLVSEAEAQAATSSTRAPVVFVVFDEFPLLSLLDERSEIDAERYPNFAALARESTWFARTLALSGDTTKAVPSLLTGRRPDPDRLPFAGDHPNNLFTLLGESHRLHVVEPMTSLCPEELCPGRTSGGFIGRQRRLFSDVGVVYGHVLLPQGLTERLPSISSTWMDFRDNALHDLRDRDDDFRAFIASITPRSEPALWFIHTLLPHHPWRYLPSGSEYARATLIPGVTNDVWGSDPVLVEQAYQRHLLQVDFVDRLLGDLIARLRATGLYDRSLIAVTADHGVSFQPNAPRRRLTAANAAEVGLVPLFVKAPQQREGDVVEALVHSHDVLPTIADALDVEVPWRVDGRSGYEAAAAPASELEAELADVLRRRHALFASGLYRIGPHRELIGRRVEDLAVRETAVTSELADPHIFANVGMSGLSPAHVVGVIEGDEAERGLDVAIAVDGTVAATARTFTFAGAVRFEAMAPESAFHPGRNDVDVYLITPRGELQKTRGRP
jgi:hypothetical protein